MLQLFKVEFVHSSISEIEHTELALQESMFCNITQASETIPSETKKAMTTITSISVGTCSINMATVVPC